MRRISDSDLEKILEEINHLRDRKNAVILAHNYQRPEVQDIADFVGDSLNLSRYAARTDAEIIVFAGVDFMAETAAILNPDRKVYIPDPLADCPMAHMVDEEDLLRMKEKHPGASIVAYINTTARTKAVADVCCTSANAVKVVEALDSEEVIFTPDRNLASYVQRFTQKRVIPCPERGHCPTHKTITVADIAEVLEEHPDARIVVHPECDPEVIDLADHVASTEGIVRYVKNSSDREFIIGTEIGILHRLRKEAPGKACYPAYQGAICPNMKKNTLEKILRVLKDEPEECLVRVDEEIARRALEPIERMLEIV